MAPAPSGANHQIRQKAQRIWWWRGRDEFGRWRSWRSSWHGIS